MFKMIGVALAFYVGYALISGRVYAKAGIAARHVSRDESPGYYWVVLIIYAGLSMALITVF